MAEVANDPGFGSYEYFRFAEDVGAVPLPVAPAW